MPLGIPLISPQNNQCAQYGPLNCMEQQSSTVFFFTDISHATTTAA